MEAEAFDYTDSQKRVGLGHSGTSAADKILAPIFTDPRLTDSPDNPSGFGLNKEDIFGLDSWSADGKPGLKRLQCS
jgi:hypothetical protein